MVGTSAGAVVGAAYASGLSLRQIESMARELQVSSLVDSTWSTSGIMHGDYSAN